MNIFLSLCFALASFTPSTQSLSGDAMLYFNTTDCPSGYTLFSYLERRFILGTGTGYNGTEVLPGSTGGSEHIVVDPLQPDDLHPVIPPYYGLKPCIKLTTDIFAPLAQVNALADMLATYQLTYTMHAQRLAADIAQINKTQKVSYFRLTAQMDSLNSEISAILASLHSTLDNIWLLINDINRTATMNKKPVSDKINLLHNNFSLEMEQLSVLDSDVKKLNNSELSLARLADDYKLKSNKMYLSGGWVGLIVGFGTSTILGSLIIFYLSDCIVVQQIKQFPPYQKEPSLSSIKANNE